MRNRDLSSDYISRAEARLAAVDALFAAQSWADVVRESQEVVELALKGLVRSIGIDPPRIHDVSDLLLAERDRLPPRLAADLEKLTSASRELRRDRELAFYGTEDLTPSDFYKRPDAEKARESAKLVVRTVKPFIV